MSRVLRLQVIVTSTYWLLVVSVVFSVAGMAVLLLAPQVAGRMGALLPWFMKGPTWIYMVTVPALVFLLYARDKSIRARCGIALLGGGIGLIAELIGTNTGYPFGAYSYTDFLNPKIFGDVPYLIPLSWYATSVLAFDFASRIRWTGVRRILAGAVFMVMWDIALDPAMVAAFPVWQWHVDGFFYGMPVMNLIGWLLTSTIIMGAYERFIGDIAIPSYRWTLAVWFASAALPLGMAATRSLWLAVIVGTAAVIVPPLTVWVKRHTGSRVTVGMERAA